VRGQRYKFSSPYRTTFYIQNALRVLTRDEEAAEAAAGDDMDSTT
jgi:hypothetical protein